MPRAPGCRQHGTWKFLGVIHRKTHSASEHVAWMRSVFPLWPTVLASRTLRPVRAADVLLQAVKVNRFSSSTMPTIRENGPRRNLVVSPGNDRGLPGILRRGITEDADGDG